MGSYSFKDGKEAHVGVDILTTFHSEEERFHKHGPLRVVNKHCRLCKYKWPYQLEEWRERVNNYDEVIYRMRGSSSSKKNLTEKEKVEREKPTKEGATKAKFEEEDAKVATQKEGLEKEAKAPRIQ